MIKSNELRIGNLIENGFKKSNGFPDYIDRVVSLSEEGEINIWSESLKNQNGGSECMVALPIQLTEDWLIKLGFERLSEKYYILDMCEFSTRYYYSYSGGFWRFEVEGKLVSELKYVHQIQNIYFVLTGKELILNSTSID